MSDSFRINTLLYATALKKQFFCCFGRSNDCTVVRFILLRNIKKRESSIYPLKYCG